MTYDDVSIILPTLNEGRNIAMMLERIGRLYPGATILVTDDGSNDDTRAQCRASDVPVQFIDRAERPVHGLTVSVLEAIGEVKTTWFVVIDADGQHPPETIAEIVAHLKEGQDLVIASRARVVGPWAIQRKAISRLGTLIGRMSLRLRGRYFGTADILSGFFGVRTASWRDNVAVRGETGSFRSKGFKILFDYLKCIPPGTPVGEVWYDFEVRGAGYSKLTFRIYREFILSCFLR